MVGFKEMNQDPPLRVKFISAGLAGCCADMVTFPLDLAKVRLQIQGEGTVPATVGQGHLRLRGDPSGFKYRGMIHTVFTIAKEEGPKALYNGLAPGLQRQLCFCSVRIGLYDAVKGFYINLLGNDKAGGQNIGLRILAGVTTGGMAVAVAQPTDVVKVRMQAETSGKGPKRYAGSIDAYRTIGRTEGIKGLWKGVAPNITRNGVVNASEIVSYDLIKLYILKYKLLSDNMPCHFVSAFGAGFVTTILASPVDVVKTRYMNSRPGQYTGAINCATLMFKEGGPLAFYKGFMPSFIRLASWNIVMFVCFEQFKRGFMQLSMFNSDADKKVKVRSSLA